MSSIALLSDKDVILALLSEVSFAKLKQAY